jgi:hypothetical protein
VTVRGAFVPANVAAQDIGDLCRAFGAGIPGATIGYDSATGCGFIRDPLGSPELARTRETIEKRRAGGASQPEPLEYPASEKRFEGAHGPTWLGHMRRLVAAGVAKVVKGKLPDSDPAEMKTGSSTPPRPTEGRPDSPSRRAAGGASPGRQAEGAGRADGAAK